MKSNIKPSFPCKEIPVEKSKEDYVLTDEELHLFKSGVNALRLCKAMKHKTGPWDEMCDACFDLHIRAITSI